MHLPQQSGIGIDIAPVAHRAASRTVAEAHQQEIHDPGADHRGRGSFTNGILASLVEDGLPRCRRSAAWKQTEIQEDNYVTGDKIERVVNRRLDELAG
jgi:hypothetical protein